MTEYSPTPTSSRTTPLAIVLSLVLVVPGMFVGGLVAWVYLFFTKIGMGDDGGSWIPFLNGIFKILWIVILPEFIRGLVAMAGSLWISFLAFKRANKETVTYSVLTVYLIIAIGLSVFSYFHKGFSYEIVSMCGLMVGFVVGSLTIIEQLDRAAQELHGNHPISSRIALILIDHAIELMGNYVDTSVDCPPKVRHANWVTWARVGLFHAVELV
jgi:hypothetical protein